MTSHRIHQIIAGLLLAVAEAGDTQAQVFDTAEAEPTGRIIIKYARPDTTPGFISHRLTKFSRSNWRRSQGMQVARRISPQLELLTPSGSATDTEAINAQAQQLSSNQEVEYASPEYRRYPLLRPNDPLYLDGTVPGNQSYLYEGDYSVQAPGAWDITTGSSSSVIAVIDTGVLPHHPELVNRSVAGLGYDFVSADAPGDFTSANDGNGRDADPTDPGDPCNASPSSWHGTGVASVAAGNSNDAEGIAGVDWNASLLHARALGRCGGTDADIIDAVRWSAGLQVGLLPMNTTPANVINLSFGGITKCTLAWQDVITELNALGVSLVIAAGNEASNALRSSPANCSGVITVGSNTPGGDIDSGFSNYGLKVTVAAPGRDIVLATNSGATTALDNGYDYHRETGSSFSAALVSGAISLLHSVNADLSPDDVRAILQDSATPFSEDRHCATYYCGSGILNLQNAVRMARDGTFDSSNNTEFDVINSQPGDLLLDQPMNGILSGYRDIQYFQVRTIETGMLTVTSTSASDLYGYLLNDKLSVLALDHESAELRDFKVAARVEPGNYYVAVERKNHRLLDTMSPFELLATVSIEQPDPFEFAEVTNASINTAITSETVQISGLLSPAVITVSGGFYSLNGGELTYDQNMVDNGDTISVTVLSSVSASSATQLQLNIGAYNTSFVVTTADQKITPPESGGGSIFSHNRELVLALFAVYLTISAGRRGRRKNTKVC